MVEIEYDKTPVKLTIYDRIAIFVICASFLIFQTIHIVMAIFLITCIILVLIDYYFNNEKFRNKAIKVLNIALIFVILFCIADTILTHLSVNYYQIAIEINPAVVFLWDNLGIVFGEIIRLSLASLFFITMFDRLNCKNKVQSFVAGIIIICSFLLWLLVVIWNSSILYEHLFN